MVAYLTRVPVLCVVHMNNPPNAVWYEHSDTGPSLEKLRYVIESADHYGVPIIFLELDSFFEEPKILTNGLSNCHYICTEESECGNGFVPDNGTNPLKELLDVFSVTDIAIGGYNRTKCVLSTATSAVTNGFKVHTTNEILFGNVNNTPESDEKAMKIFAEIGIVYNNVKDLVRSLFPL